MKAIEFVKQLEQNPEYTKMKQQKQKVIQKKKEQIKIIEAPIITDLHINGFKEITSIGDLLKLKKANVLLTELLLKWIPKINNEHGLQEVLIRGLAIAEKPFDGRLLINLFDSADSTPSLRWAIGNTIASAKVENVTIWLNRKFNAFSLGKENEMLIYAIAKYFPHKKASMILKSVFTNYPLQVADAFSNIGNQGDLRFLEEQVDNYKGVVHTGIKKSIKNFKKKLL